MNAVQARVPAGVQEMSPRSSGRVDQTRESGGNRACRLYYLKIYMYFTNHAARERIPLWSWALVVKKSPLERHIGIITPSNQSTEEKQNLAASQKPQSRVKYVWDFQRLPITKFDSKNLTNFSRTV